MAAAAAAAAVAVGRGRTVLVTAADPGQGKVTMTVVIPAVLKMDRLTAAAAAVGRVVAEKGRVTAVPAAGS